MNLRLQQLSPSDGKDIYDFLQTLPDENGFGNDAYGIPYEEFPAWLKKQDDMAKGINLASWMVPSTQYWAFVDDTPVGIIRLRHYLTPGLLENGGHIGYAVTKAQRGKGYAKEMLKQICTIACDMGIDKVMLTANVDNQASRKTMESCGGILAKEENDHAFYWILVSNDPFQVLETERLILRPFVQDDLEDFYAYAKVEGVGENAGWPHHTDINITNSILQEFINKGDVYAIVDKEKQKVIGSIGIHDRTFDPTIINKKQRELGYVLSKDYWGKGLMSEAIRAIIPYTFDVMHVDILWCGHFSFNDRSRRVIEKMGFTYYGDGKYNAYLLGEVYDEKQYWITKEAYYK